MTKNPFLANFNFWGPAIGFNLIPSVRHHRFSWWTSNSIQEGWDNTFKRRKTQFSFWSIFGDFNVEKRFKIDFLGCHRILRAGDGPDLLNRPSFRTPPMDLRGFSVLTEILRFFDPCALCLKAALTQWDVHRDGEFPLCLRTCGYVRYPLSWIWIFPLPPSLRLTLNLTAYTAPFVLIKNKIKIFKKHNLMRYNNYRKSFQ